MYELVIIKNLLFDLGQGSWRLHFPISKMERPSREDNIELTSQRPPPRSWPEGPCWFSAGLSSEGWDIRNHPGPPQIWTQVQCRSSWSLLFTLFPREQDSSSPWLKGSNFKHWILGRQKGQILATYKMRALKKDYPECRGQNRGIHLSLLPQAAVSACPLDYPGGGGRQVSVPWGSSHFTKRSRAS